MLSSERKFSRNTSQFHSRRKPQRPGYTSTLSRTYFLSPPQQNLASCGDIHQACHTAPFPEELSDGAQRKSSQEVNKLTETAQQSSCEASIIPDKEIAACRIKTLIKAIIRIDSVSYGQCTKYKG